MKLIHLSDLHLGKRINEYSMLEDQQFVLKEILKIVDDEKPDAVIIAGDVYDKTVPAAEAVQLFDDFLFRLSERNLQVMVISGNHDSAERISFGSRIMDKSGIHLAPVYNGNVSPVVLHDEYGDVAFYMFPFVKPATVRHCFQEADIVTYTDAARVAVDAMDVDQNRRNVIIAHQFVTGAEHSDSEESFVGGLDNVDASVFNAFDYVALGHLHRPQNCDGTRIRYCGSPLKYSFSEVHDVKSVTLVELGPKGTQQITTLPLKFKHDWQDLRGTYDEVIAKTFYEGTTYCDDYVRITLTDEDDILDAIARLRTIYHNLMELHYDNRRTRTVATIGAAEDVERKTPISLFSELFKKQNGQEMSEEQKNYMDSLIKDIWEGQS